MGIITDGTLDDYLKLINSKKEEILKAFIAQHGFAPDQAELVEERTDTGFTVHIRKFNNGKTCKIIYGFMCVSFNVDGVIWSNDLENQKLIAYHKAHYEDLGYRIEIINNMAVEI